MLEKLGDGPLLAADSRLGIPSIHDWQGAEHLGFGLFHVELENAALHFDGGGAMARTPSGKGWTALRVKGPYVYPFTGVRQTLDAFLARTGPDERTHEPSSQVHSAALAEAPGPSTAQAAAEKVPWLPSQEDLVEFETLGEALLKGELGRGGDGYPALRAVKRSGTLKVALESVGANTKRCKLIKQQLRALQR